MRKTTFFPLQILLPRLALVCLFGVWTVSTSVIENDYFKGLSESFLKLHLYYPDKPNPVLFLLKNPYDPSALQWAIHDLSYFNGKYWLYWSPLPTLLYMPFLILSIPVNSKVIGVLLLVGISLVFFAFQVETLRNVSKRSMKAKFSFSVCLIISSGILIALRRPATYEIPILFASLLSITGIWVFFKIMQRSPEKNPRNSFFLIGLFLSMATWCRPSYIGTFFVVCTAIYFWCSKDIKNWLYQMRYVVVGCLPTVSTFFIYNQLRFGDPLEIGHRYQIAGISNASLGGPSIDWTLTAFSQYIFGVPRIISEFPFVALGSSPIYSYPQGYIYEPTIGLIWLCPVYLLFFTYKYSFRNIEQFDLAKKFGILTILSGNINLIINTVLIGSTSFRYIIDGSVLIALGVALTFSKYFERANKNNHKVTSGKKHPNRTKPKDIFYNKEQKAIRNFVVTLSALGCVISLLISLTGYYDPLNIID